MADYGPASIDVLHRQGDRVAVPFTFKTNGAATDVSDRTFRAQIFADKRDRELVTNCTVDMADAESGRVFVVLPAASSAELHGGYRWEFKDLTLERTVAAGRWNASSEGDA